MSGLLSLSAHRSYHLYRKETDMRKGFNQLCGIVTNELGRQVTQGDAFIFINRPRTHLKLLVYEQGGFTIFYRRLEQGACSSLPINCILFCRASRCKRSVTVKDINNPPIPVENKIIGMMDHL